MSKRDLILLAVCVLLALTSAGTGIAKLKSTAPTFLWFHESGRLGPPTGIVLAAWMDGRVIYASDPNKPGVDLRVGEVRPEAIARVVRIFECMDFEGQISPVGRVLDAAYVSLCFAKQPGAQVNRLGWNAPMGAPGLADFCSNSEQDRAFAQCFLAGRALLSTLRPAPDGKLIAEEEAKQLTQLAEQWGLRPWTLENQKPPASK